MNSPKSALELSTGRHSGGPNSSTTKGAPELACGSCPSPWALFFRLAEADLDGVVRELLELGVAVVGPGW